MFFFAYPAALLALTGLLVPLAIHLWNRRPGRVVPVGALRWLTAGANRRMRQLHLTQWPLLLLRLLVLTLLALAIAGPRWTQPPAPARPQVLLTPAALASPAWPVIRPTVDSLRRRGAELRLFGPGFPLLPDSLNTLSAAARRLDTLTAPDQYWARAAQAADSFPAQPLYVFTTAELPHFRGTRPALPARLHWQTLPAATDSGAWLQSAVRSPPDSLRLVVGSGNATATAFRAYRQPWPAQLPHTFRVPGLPPLQLAQQGAQFTVRPVTADSTKRELPVPVQLPTQVRVYYDAASRAEDVRYVRAALRAAAPAYPHGLQLTVSTTLPSPADSLAWLIWLADAPLPAALGPRLQRGLRVLRDASGTGSTIETTFQPGDFAKPVGLLRRTAPAAPAGITLWQDALGQPVLSQQRVGRGAVYQLHTRFHPQWSGLPTDGQLPAVLLHFLVDEDATLTDFRQLASAQITAHQAAKESPQIRRPADVLDLRPWAVIGAGLLFALERLLAHRRSSAAISS